MVNIRLHAIHKHSKAERNYSQLDKEGLAVIFGLGKSHKFVYGRHVKIITDHKASDYIVWGTQSDPSNHISTNTEVGNYA